MIYGILRQMTYRILILLVIICIIITGAFISGCSEDEESSPYGTPVFSFPEDEGAHRDFSAEWWYLNASLTDSEGHEYGAMAAYFNPELRIISISDLDTETFYRDVSGMGPLSSYMPDYTVGELDLRWRDSADRWYRTDSDTLSYHIAAYGDEISLDLEYTSGKPPLPVGGNGLVEWTDGSTYYYSLTRLQVEGQIEIEDELIDVEGIGWMDHQWMDSLLNLGWDWFSVQLEDNTEIILWQLVGKDETPGSLDMTVMFPDNSVYYTRDFSLERLESWTSPESGSEYGILWRVREDTLDLDLEIKARYPEHEIRVTEHVPAIDFDFWEGMTTVSGSMGGEQVSGTGYAELVRPPRIGNQDP